MPVRDDLGIRMKTYYEQIPKTKLMRRTPVMIRIDGKAFHTFTKGFQKPFDTILIKSMQETTKYLCENIQGCVLGYTQSDEITLVLVDYQNFETAAWFDYEVQKMCSIAASMATMSFNRFFARGVDAFAERLEADEINEAENEKNKLLCTYRKAVEKGAMFDARVFNIPKEEVTNCIYWRQLEGSFPCFVGKEFPAFPSDLKRRRSPQERREELQGRATIPRVPQMCQSIPEEPVFPALP